MIINSTTCGKTFTIAALSSQETQAYSISNDTVQQGMFGRMNQRVAQTQNFHELPSVFSRLILRGTQRIDGCHDDAQYAIFARWLRQRLSFSISVMCMQNSSFYKRVTDCILKRPRLGVASGQYLQRTNESLHLTCTSQSC
jgi:hypothetical protein